MIEKYKNKQIYISSYGIYKNKILKKIFNPISWNYIKTKNLNKLKLDKDSIFIVWGKKDNTLTVSNYCKENNITLLRLEDGFIRSMGLGVNNFKSYSYIIDDLGIFYDNTTDNRLKHIIKNQNLNNEEKIYIRSIIKDIIDNKISKYNIKTNDINEININNNKKNILIIGQVDGDMSLKYGQIGETTYMDIINYIKNNNDEEIEIYFKIHPDILSGKKKSNLNIEELKKNNIKIINKNYNSIEFLNIFDEVHVFTSQMGFEALLLNKKVYTWGVPFYSGYGLTIDKNKYYDNKVFIKKTLEEIFKSLYIDYTIYYDFKKYEYIDIKKLIEIINGNKKNIKKYNFFSIFKFFFK